MQLDGAVRKGVDGSERLGDVFEHEQRCLVCDGTWRLLRDLLVKVAGLPAVAGLPVATGLSGH